MLKKKGMFFVLFILILLVACNKDEAEQTTNYTKNSWRPTFGVGGDYFASGGGNCRWQLFYITKGSDKSNAVQGPEFQLWIPSPVSKSHFFYRQTLGVYEFHTTVTDPKDLRLAPLQIGQRSSAAFLDFTVGWRF